MDQNPIHWHGSAAHCHLAYARVLAFLPIKAVAITLPTGSVKRAFVLPPSKILGKGMIPELTLLMCREKQNPGTHESRILELELSLHLTLPVRLWARHLASVKTMMRNAHPFPEAPACGRMLYGVIREIKILESTSKVLTSD